jgi:hypothetical protein
MLASPSPVVKLAAVTAGCLLLAGCSIPLPWPESPLYETPTNDPNWVRPATKEEAMAAMAGHYAHYDIVAYDGETANGPLATFIVSYGFTDLVSKTANWSRTTVLPRRVHRESALRDDLLGCCHTGHSARWCDRRCVRGRWRVEDLPSCDADAQRHRR